MPPLMLHISCVQTPVNAAGKNSSTVFFLPKLLLNLMCVMPEAFLDLSVKSGALEPTGIAIILIFDLRFTIFKTLCANFSVGMIHCQTTLSHRFSQMKHK